MKVAKFLLITLLLAAFTDATAQLRTKYFWVGIGAGVTNYKGDLDDNFTVKFTKPGLAIVGGYKFHPHMSARLQFAQGWVKASDAKSGDPVRERRNLSFRSPITELSLQLQYEFFANTRKYTYRPKYTPYVFAGVGAFKFNPQAKLGDEWYDLQPLGTEGQNLSGPMVTHLGDTVGSYPEPYDLVQVCIPVGAGIRYKLTDKIDLNLEIGLRKIFTDYLDDVSNQYPDMDALRAQDPIAAQLSDRMDPAEFPEGGKFWNGIRGDKTQDDWYVLTMVSATYILDWVKCPKFR